mmetsp:Transcript_14549/g.25616  ORF Transcript_14549/g.25616 Transcript_14549/m.25616 type:complete len:204 (-) Transcript_14549:406-1017(-)
MIFPGDAHSSFGPAPIVCEPPGKEIHRELGNAVTEGGTVCVQSLLGGLRMRHGDQIRPAGTHDTTEVGVVGEQTTSGQHDVATLHAGAVLQHCQSNRLVLAKRRRTGCLAGRDGGHAHYWRTVLHHAHRTHRSGGRQQRSGVHTGVDDCILGKENTTVELFRTAWRNQKLILLPPLNIIASNLLQNIELLSELSFVLLVGQVE